MTSRSGALIALPSWGSEPQAAPDQPSLRPERMPSSRRVRWGVRAAAGADVAAGAGLLAATAGLWAAFLLAVW